MSAYSDLILSHGPALYWRLGDMPGGGPFGTPLIDDFNYANNARLAWPWITPVLDHSYTWYAVNSNQAVSQGGGWGAAYWPYHFPGSLCEMYVTLPANPNNYVYMVLQKDPEVTNGNRGGFGLEITPGSPATFDVYELCNPGAGYGVGTATQTIAAGGRVALTYDGTTARAWYSAPASSTWAIVASHTAVYTGLSGPYTNLYGRIVGTPTFDNFGGGAFTLTAADSSGSGNAGTYTNSPTLGVAGAIAGDGNTAVSLNGSTQYITSALAAFTNGSVRTFEGWAWRNSSAADHTLFGGSGSNIPLLAARSGTNVTFWANNGGAGIAWATAWLGTSTWIHWALIFDEAADRAELFINGVSQGAQPQSVAYSGTAGNFQVGQGGGAWPGLLDEVAVYTRALTPLEIRSHYAMGVGAPPPTVSPSFTTRASQYPVP